MRLQKMPACAVRLLVGGLAALSGVVLAMSAPAHFERGQEIQVTAAQVGPKGATLSTGNHGTPVDGITVEIPAGALEQETTVTLSYNTGTLAVNSGECSGVFLRVAADRVSTFRKLVTIRVRYDAQQRPNVVVVGYAIDAKDRLRSVNTESQDRPAGTVTFSTFVPLLLTWVYAPVR